jgi:hypothetical protein
MFQNAVQQEHSVIGIIAGACMAFVALIAVGYAFIR